jgi:uncharacterized protein
MRGISSTYIFLFFFVVCLIELLSYSGVRLLLSKFQSGFRRSIHFGYLLVSFLIVVLTFYSFSNPELIRNTQNYLFFYIVITIGYLNFLPKTFFAVFVIIAQFFNLIRLKQMQLIILASSLIFSFGILLSFSYGVLIGKSNVRIEKANLYFEDLPIQLDGFKIMQLSDIHLGSMNGDLDIMEKTIHHITNINPDLLLFTGDLVNNFATEIVGYDSIFSSMRAKHGKFAIQGNHDYGDYSNWSDSIGKRKNLEGIRSGLVNNGFKMLLNRWVKIEVKDTSFILIGVENWGHPPFPQYANLDQAISDIPKNYFKILMTHDPAHWKSIVVPETDIPLSFAGHTHGGQFSIKIAGIEFSPIYFIQKNWGGLYRADNQYLYVNRGLGTIGFLGRIDMRPEISVITLHRSKGR